MMKRFREYLESAAKTARFDSTTKVPEKKTSYYAYKNGQSYKCDTSAEAYKISKNVELVYDKESIKECDRYWSTMRSIEKDAYNNWLSDLREDFGLPTKLFDLCYAEAFDRSNGSGYDEIVNILNDVVDFVENVLATKD